MAVIIGDGGAPPRVHNIDLSAIGLRRTIFGDGAIATSAPATWQELQEQLNHYYACSPHRQASQGFRNDPIVVNTVSDLVVASVDGHVAEGWLRVHLHVIAAGNATDPLIIRVREGSAVGPILSETSHAGAALTALIGTTPNPLTATGDVTLVITVSIASGQGTLAYWEVVTDKIDVSEIPPVSAPSFSSLEDFALSNLAEHLWTFDTSGNPAADTGLNPTAQLWTTIGGPPFLTFVSPSPVPGCAGYGVINAATPGRFARLPIHLDRSDWWFDATRSWVNVVTFFSFGTITNAVMFGRQGGGGPDNGRSRPGWHPPVGSPDTSFSDLVHPVVNTEVWVWITTYDSGTQDYWVYQRKDGGTEEQLNLTLAPSAYSASHIAFGSTGGGDLNISCRMHHWSTYSKVLSLADRNAVYGLVGMSPV